jgi:hypothetical protein
MDRRNIREVTHRRVLNPAAFTCFSLEEIASIAGRLA